MAIFAINVSLFIFYFSCFILSPTFISSVAARNKVKAQLANQVCRNTTDYNFCQKTIYSDPQAPTADRVVLAYIVFSSTYLNASNTHTQIQHTIDEHENEKPNVLLDGLKSCMDHYTNAIGAVSQVLVNLDSDTYYGFDKLSMEAQNHVRDCEKGFNGTTRSPAMSKANADIIKLTDICNVVAQLFPYV